MISIRLWIPGPHGLKAIEGDARLHYDLGPVEGDLLNERYMWRTRVRVPGYDLSHSLVIDLEEFGVHAHGRGLDRRSAPAHLRSESFVHAVPR